MFCLLLMCVCLCVTDHIMQAVNATGDLAFLTLWLLQVVSSPSFSINCKNTCNLAKKGK